MKKIPRKFEDLFIDITFAEDRGYEVIRGIAERLENIFVAIAFAEEGEAEEAQRHKGMQYAVRRTLCG